MVSAHERDATSILSPVNFRWLTGLLLLLTAVAASLILVLQHLERFRLPGCQGGCAELAAGRWHDFSLAVSLAGLAYFTALLIFWATTSALAFPRWCIWIVRAGILVSLAFAALMLTKGHICPYCLVAHAANLGFWFLAESPPTSSRVRSVFALTFAAAMVLGLLSHGLFQVEMQTRLAATRERQLRDSIAQIVRRAATQQQETNAAVPALVIAGGSLADDSPPSLFASRHQLGPERASLRLVVYFDYVCKDCRDAEEQIRRVLSARDDVSLVVRHFPLCKECNGSIKNARFHANACRAARAAEAAGLLGGEDGFWKMHSWLFEHAGQFTDQQLGEALPELGFANTEQFLATMQGDEARRHVNADVAEALRHGLTETPVIFVNGMELCGADATGTIERSLAKLLEHGLPLLTAAADYPPLRCEPSDRR